MIETTLTLPAFAKINWTLRVIGKRPDGYHEIDTIFQTISLHDTIRIESTDEKRIELFCDPRSLPSGKHNLVYRTAAALQASARIDRGARIRLEKRIPTHAGLGGGSSDAAVTLMALAHLWRTNVTQGNLLEIATDVGADVPFFFFGGTARGAGIGADVTAHRDLREQFLLTIKPNTNISTRRAYELLKAPALTTSKPKTILSSSLTNGVFYSLSTDALRNDFETVALQLAPEIARAKEALLRAGAAAALLAGSGSAVFGIFDNEDAQKRAIQIIELEPGWRVFPCRTVGRSHYQSAMGAVGEVFARFSGHDAGA